MMTTMAALVGTLPTALGLGAGAESRRPLGLAVVGGLLVSQLLTLYITPVYYVYMEKAQRGFARKPARHAEPQPVADGSAWARLPPRVPRLRTCGSPISAAASETIGHRSRSRADEATS
jgi:hypothetical protein